MKVYHLRRNLTMADHAAALMQTLGVVQKRIQQIHERMETIDGLRQRFLKRGN